MSWLARTKRRLWVRLNYEWWRWRDKTPTQKWKRVFWGYIVRPPAAVLLLPFFFVYRWMIYTSRRGKVGRVVLIDIHSDTGATFARVTA